MTRAAKGSTRYRNVAVKPSQTQCVRSSAGHRWGIGRDAPPLPSERCSMTRPFVSAFCAISLGLGCGASSPAAPKVPAGGSPGEAPQLFVPPQPLRVTVPDGNKDEAAPAVPEPGGDKTKEEGRNL